MSQWGLPAWLVPVTRSMEAIGVVLVLILRFSSYGAVMIFAAMVSATGTHLAHGEMNRFAFPLVLAVLAVLVGLARRRHAVGPLGDRILNSHKKSFVSAVYDFVFGPPRVAIDPLQNEKELAAYLQRNRGVVGEAG